MSFNLGSVVAKVTADISDFKNKMSDAQGSMKSFSDTTKQNLTKVRNTAAVATAGIVAVGAATLNLAKIAGKYESIKDAFGSMTDGIVDDVDTFEKKVQSASGNTIDRLTILTNGTRALGLIGKDAFSDFGDQFASMAELSKKAARATGTDVNFMFDSLVTGIARESKMILDNLGITVDITAAKEEYAASLGKTRNELTQNEEKTAVLNSTLALLDEKYKDVAVSSGGFSGAWQQLTATMTDFKIELGTAVLPLINELVRVILPIIKQYLPIFIQKVIDIITWFKNLEPWQQKIIAAFVLLAPAILVVTSMILALIPVITAIFSPIGLLITWVILLAKTFVDKFTFIVEVGKVMWSELKSLFNNGLSFLKSIGQKIKDAIMKPFIDAKNKAWDAVNSIREAMERLNPLKRQSPSVVDLVKKGVTALGNEFDRLGNFNIPSLSQQVSLSPTTAGSGGVGGVIINLPNAVISSQRDADELGLRVGESLVRTLKKSVRF